MGGKPRTDTPADRRLAENRHLPPHGQPAKSDPKPMTRQSSAPSIKTTSKPWDGSAANYSDADAYAKACLIDENPAGQAKVKTLCKLPVYEPDGTLNVNAVHAAAAALAGGRGGVQASPAAKKAAAKKLTRIYGQLNQPVPSSIKSMAQ